MCKSSRVKQFPGDSEGDQRHKGARCEQTGQYMLCIYGELMIKEMVNILILLLSHHIRFQPVNTFTFHLTIYISLSLQSPNALLLSFSFLALCGPQDRETNS